MLEFFALLSFGPLLLFLTVMSFVLANAIENWLVAFLEDWRLRRAIDRHHLEEKLALDRRATSDRLDVERARISRTDFELHATLTLPPPAENKSLSLPEFGESLIEGQPATDGMVPVRPR